MRLNKLTLQNWKCFKKKKTVTFKDFEIIVGENGTGKSSIFQGISYAIWGKYPLGFNGNTVRNDVNKSAKVELWFDFGKNNLNQGYIHREFGLRSVCQFTVNGKLLSESVREIRDEMEKIIPYEISSQIWSNSIIDSDIMNANYFTNTILKDILKDPIKLKTYYKSEGLMLSKKLNLIDFTHIDIDEIKDRLDKQELKIRNANKIKQYDFERATNVKNAIKELKSFDKDKVLDKDIINNYKNIAGNRDIDSVHTYLQELKQQLKEEKSKTINEYNKYNKSTIKSLAKDSVDRGKCIICDSEYKQEGYENLVEKLNKPSRSENTINQLEDMIKYIDIDDSYMEQSIKYYQVKQTADSMPNYQEVLDKYNKDSEQLWSDYKKIQDEYNNALIQQSKIDAANELKKQRDEDRIKYKIVNSYIVKATEYYTRKILDNASSILESLNSRYKSIFIDNGSFDVLLEDENHEITIVPVAQLSTGEKTMCALSLLFSVHDIMVPELPFLFDEVFSGLDAINVEQVKKFLHNQQSQILIITHDTNWEEE